MGILTKAVSLVRGGLTDTVKSKVRLWIEYLMIAAIVVLLGMTAWGKIQTSRLETKVATLGGDLRETKGQLKQVVEVNKAQAEAIQTIKGLTSTNDTLLTALATDMQALRVRDQSTFSRLAALEKSNEAVRRYMSTAVPAELRCVLDSAPCGHQDGNGVPGAQRGAAAPVPRSGAGTQRNHR